MKYSKLFGLFLLDELDIHHPNWRFFVSPKQIPTTKWTNDKYGWTIRTANRKLKRIDNEEYHLPFINMIKWEEVGEYAESIFKESKSDNIVLIIYPSWQFECSGTIMFQDKAYLIEAVWGSIGKLTSGIKGPDLQISSSPGPPFIIKDYSGNDLLYRYVNKLNFNKHLDILSYFNGVLEWSYTVDKQFYFHQWDIMSKVNNDYAIFQDFFEKLRSPNI